MYLARRIKELVNKDLDLVKEYWVYGWIQLMANQFLDMFLYLGPKLLIVTNKQLQQMPYKSAKERLIFNQVAYNKQACSY